MFLNKTERKKRHPYRTLAILTLAMTGVVSVASSTMEFVKDKAACMMSWAEKMKK